MIGLQWSVRSIATVSCVLAVLAAGVTPASAEDPPPEDPPGYEECSATAASKEGDDKFEFDNCAGPCPPPGGFCGTQDFELGGVHLVGCGCKVGAGPTLDCCQIVISQDGAMAMALGSCLQCSYSGECKEDVQTVGTHVTVYATCK
jgi:hypothetical protein